LVIFFGCGNNANDRNLISSVCFPGELNPKPEYISIEDNASIKKLNGKFVKMKGIIHFAFEDVALYATHNSNRNKAIWLNLKISDTIPSSTLYKLYGLEIFVVGRIDISRKGHEGAYIATLDSAFISCK
jgi:hypothetical protein